MKNHHHNGPVHSTSTNSRGEIHDSIAARAYDLWEREGKPEHRSDAIWLAAEQEVVTGHRAQPTDPVPPVSF